MQTYKYRFPAYGWLGSRTDAETYAAALEENLNDSPDCLMAYCIFPSDSEILDRVTFDMDGNYKVKAVNLHTYTELYDGCENDLKNCVEDNLANTSRECFLPNQHMGVIIDGDVELLGREGDIPKTLYHIAEMKDLDSIMEKGLIPGTGSNNYKNMEDYVYLSSEKDLAPWLAVLKHAEDPVILEVNTESLTGIETGRSFKDRGYVKGSYSEYRTTEPIPASAIKAVNLGKGHNEFSINLQAKMHDQLLRTASENELDEVTRGLNRLADMGIVRKSSVEIVVSTHKSLLEQTDKKEENIKSSNTPNPSNNEKLPQGEDAIDQFMRAIGEWDDNRLNERGKGNMSLPENFKEDSEGLPFDENDSGADQEDDFTKAINEMSGTQMTLEDFGVKL